MADNEDKTPSDKPAAGAAADAKPGGGTQEGVVSRPDLRPRNLSPSERESLRARLQKKFH
ncbi:hypothetical protein [Bradyrhizobium sp.]|uniref:hypothetical protein n=1 Tax=Bradyrhizobium sp. TaxID=376 RepID=UPI001DBB575A|nr:hypothetical protein [Bradyrhizobium sp.]MBV8702039.1 hypothetical protein [Bradyrhizobium sp.]MBV8921126.1 hypothetical protein [Bradyrhizobium sp.]MBV9981123.1 hypothetical protein [Bradyrhizobium sp.]